LLVVVGIIFILVSLLFPALSKTRDMGKRIACSSNQKQIFLAWFNYEQDFEYKPMPLCSTKTVDGISYNLGGPWQRHLVSGGYVIMDNFESIYWQFANPKYPQIDGPSAVGIYACPAHENDGLYWYATHYGINAYMGDLDPLASTHWQILTLIKHPSKVLLFGDRIRVTTKSILTYNSGPNFRHGGGWNNIFIDGHYSWRSISDTYPGITCAYWGHPWFANDYP
jgi:hypothetical protein